MVIPSGAGSSNAFDKVYIGSSTNVNNIKSIMMLV